MTSHCSRDQAGAAATAPAVGFIATVLKDSMPAAIVIPACLEPLMNQRRWLIWRKETGRGGRSTKVPYRADYPSSRASSNDPATWCSLETAMRVYSEGSADGIAFALLGSGIAAFDLDDCRDTRSGVLHQFAQRLVDRCSSYAEITPSREGIRILGKASGPKIHRKFAIANGASVEVYRDCERFITVTGEQIAPACDRLADIDTVLDKVVAELDTAKQAKNRSKSWDSVSGMGRTSPTSSRTAAARASAATKAARSGSSSTRCLSKEKRRMRLRRSSSIPPTGFRRTCSAGVRTRPHTHIAKSTGRRRSATGARRNRRVVRIPRVQRSFGSRPCRRCVTTGNGGKPPGVWVSARPYLIHW